MPSTPVFRQASLASVASLIGLLVLALPTHARAQGQGPGACAPPNLAASPYGVRPDLIAQSNEWFDCGTGGLLYPPDDGFATPPGPMDETLAPGSEIDRYGSPYGRFFATPGASCESRSLPYDCPNAPYAVYVVLQSLPVEAGLVAPWFNEPGGAEQYETPQPQQSAQYLLSNGYLAVVPEPATATLLAAGLAGLAAIGGGRRRAG